MIIKNIFEKAIDRDIKGVIKVAKDKKDAAEDSSYAAGEKQELEEYVVTRELQKHFTEFFSNYKKGIVGNTDKMGVWISGFFGSGKSHFLKILSYLLENKVVDGKTALDYFIDDKKIIDPMVIADMKLAADTSTDVILFNVDSKGESGWKRSEDAIVSVFLKAFNEMQGFCGSEPYVADLERQLAAKGKYELFKETFAKHKGSPWEEEREAVIFIQDELVDTLVEMGEMSEEAARNFCAKATEPYSISIEGFAKTVKKYIESKGSNHHVVFLVDEIGQYIADNSKLMLNLQTVTEDLGTFCGGKAWIIVTSQQNIDDVTKVKGDDFSKIQGRFDTRLNLSSANADEVIKKRILRKNETAATTLALLFDEKSTVIGNTIVFNDGIEKKLYSGREDFADVYPFIPYQFNLAGNMLTKIREYSASGKHMADGERSLLALFKESAMKIMNEDIGALVPFSRFYEPIQKFIDHSHRIVIEHALDMDAINPTRDPECFDVQVLKVLFMIKYVKEIKANADNITSLMISHIDEDRLALKQKVEDALKRLTRQTLVQKNGETYVFLTNEEQEINHAVERQSIELGDVIARVSEILFDEIYDEKIYRCAALSGRYSYPFNQVVDDKPYKSNQNHALTLKILTPESDEIGDERKMMLISGQSNCVLIVLPDDRSFVDEVRATLQIEKFLRLEAASVDKKYELIKVNKQMELREHKERAKTYLATALENANIYVNGSKVNTSAKGVSSRITEAIGKLVSIVYDKMSYIDTATNADSIRAIFTDKKQQLTIGDSSTEINALALTEMNDYIMRKASKHTRVSMKTLNDAFRAPPYGFVEADVQWLVAKLFKKGEIALFVNNEAVSIVSKSVDEIIRLLTKKEFLEKLMIEKRTRPGEHQVKSVREVLKELWSDPATGLDDDILMKRFVEKAKSYREGTLKEYTRNYDIQPKFPGKAVVDRGIKLMNDVQQLSYGSEFFSYIHEHKDDFLDFAEDIEPIKKFFSSEQEKIFKKALDLMGVYDDSKNYIADQEVEAAVAKIKAIIGKSSPFGDIKDLPELLDNFMTVYSRILDEMLEPIKTAVVDARKRVFDELEGKHCHDELKDKIAKSFLEVSDKAERCTNIASLQGIKLEADALKTRFLNEISKREREIIEEQQPKPTSNNEQDKPAIHPTPVVKRRKSVSIKTINSEATWHIESTEDIDRYIAELKNKLVKQLEENTIVNIEF